MNCPYVVGLIVLSDLGFFKGLKYSPVYVENVKES